MSVMQMAIILIPYFKMVIKQVPVIKRLFGQKTDRQIPTGLMPVGYISIVKMPGCHPNACHINICWTNASWLNNQCKMPDI
jgi:hypothetical protein